MTSIETQVNATAADLAVGARKKPRPPRVQLFGDSHAHAVLRAIEKRKGKGQPIPLTAHRLLKEKNGIRIGTTSFEAFLKLIADLGPNDLVVSMVGGNQHAVEKAMRVALEVVALRLLRARRENVRRARCDDYPVPSG